nr:hypothetical protein [Tanacetum cinerariifolium]
MFDADKDLQGKDVIVEEVDAASIATAGTAGATTAVSFNELTMAQAFVEIKTSRPKAMGISMQEPSEATTTTIIIIPLIKSQDKGKGDGDDVTIDATPLSLKSPTIMDYKIYKEGRKSYFQIIRADGSYQMYLTFPKMLKNFNKKDLDVLWSIVKTRFKKMPVNYMDTLLFQCLKTMFEHYLKDNIWKNQQGLVKC